LNTKKLLVIALLFIPLTACQSIKEAADAYVENSKQSSPKPAEKPQHYNLSVDRYDEDALNEYVNSIKGILQYLSAIQTPQSSQELPSIFLLGLASGAMQASKIEIEEWPLGARKKGWAISGSKLKKYNVLIEEHRARILTNDNYSEDLRKTVERIILLDEAAMMAAS